MSNTTENNNISSSTTTREESLKQILSSVIVDGTTDKESLIKALVALGEATCKISLHLTNYVSHELAGSQNASGDDQLKLDIQCDAAVFECVKASGVYATVASEETPEETPITENGIYSLGCDPLDGSSIIDANFSVGSIYGIWPGSKLLGRTGREQVASCVALYGPRTVMCIAIPGTTSGHPPKVIEVTLIENRSAWYVSKENVVIQSKGKIFAPGNLRATNDHTKYKELVEYWMSNRYTLRYTGGMVPDIYHIFSKSKGIFTNVSSPSAKAKLRLLYEVAPMGLIVECAGGKAIKEDENKSVLDVVIDNCDKRLGVCFGSKDEVDKYMEIMFA